MTSSAAGGTRTVEDLAQYRTGYCQRGFFVGLVWLAWSGSSKNDVAQRLLSVLGCGSCPLERL